MALSGRDDLSVASAMEDAGVVLANTGGGGVWGGGGGGGEGGGGGDAAAGRGKTKRRGAQGKSRDEARREGAANGNGDAAHGDSDGGGGGGGSGGGGGGGDKGGPVSATNAAACAYVLFDTRMDIPCARPGPELLRLQQSTAVTHFPEELFMIMRVATIIRGLLGALHVDVSAAKVWEPFARYRLGLLADYSDADVDSMVVGARQVGYHAAPAGHWAVQATDGPPRANGGTFGAGDTFAADGISGRPGCNSYHGGDGPDGKRKVSFDVDVLAFDRRRTTSGVPTGPGPGRDGAGQAAPTLENGTGGFGSFQRQQLKGAGSPAVAGAGGGVAAAGESGSVFFLSPSSSQAYSIKGQPTRLGTAAVEDVGFAFL